MEDYCCWSLPELAAAAAAAVHLAAVAAVQLAAAAFVAARTERCQALLLQPFAAVAEAEAAFV
jgi:hypothetical protein